MDDLLYGNPQVTFTHLGVALVCLKKESALFVVLKQI